MGYPAISNFQMGMIRCRSCGTMRKAINGQEPLEWLHLQESDVYLCDTCVQVKFFELVARLDRYYLEQKKDKEGKTHAAHS